MQFQSCHQSRFIIVRSSLHRPSSPLAQIVEHFLLPFRFPLLLESTESRTHYPSKIQLPQSYPTTAWSNFSRGGHSTFHLFFKYLITLVFGSSMIHSKVPSVFQSPYHLTRITPFPFTFNGSMILLMTLCSSFDKLFSDSYRSLAAPMDVFPLPHP